MRTTHRRPRGGVTLVEMLVVLGIILVLMGILLPGVTAAKRQARRTACEARLRVIGQALQMYLGENDDTLPQACSTNSLDSLQSRVGTESLNCNSAGVLKGFIPPTDPDKVKYFGPPG